jgi:hypothetical protein
MYLPANRGPSGEVTGSCRGGDCRSSAAIHRCGPSLSAVVNVMRLPLRASENLVMLSPGNTASTRPLSTSTAHSSAEVNGVSIASPTSFDPARSAGSRVSSHPVKTAIHFVRWRAPHRSSGQPTHLGRYECRSPTHSGRTCSCRAGTRDWERAVVLLPKPANVSFVQRAASSAMWLR